MMPFLDLRQIFRNLTASIPVPKTGVLGSERAFSHHHHPGPRCGCCPRCRAFIRIEPRRPGEMVPCPSCGRFIGFVKPLDGDLPELE
jgi:hypothetical protein